MQDVNVAKKKCRKSAVAGMAQNEEEKNYE